MIVDKLYEDKHDNFNMQIEGYDIFAEEVTSDESFNRRETNRQYIMGGTQYVMRTNYIPRSYSFKTHLFIEPHRPDAYDSLFRDWCSRPVEIISPELGGKFKAELTIKREHRTPRMIEVTFQAVEVPERQSNIEDDFFLVPEDKITKEVKESLKGAKK